MIILAAGTTGTVIATVVAFLVISLLLISVLLFVKQKLSPSGPVKIMINGEREIEVASGGTLLSTLGNQKIFLPSACGGGGTCIQCECHVLEPQKNKHRHSKKSVSTSRPPSATTALFATCTF